MHMRSNFQKIYTNNKFFPTAGVRCCRGNCIANPVVNIHVLNYNELKPAEQKAHLRGIVAHGIHIPDQGYRYKLERGTRLCEKGLIEAFGVSRST